LRRILLAGNTGAGKTTVGKTLATSLGVPYHELDALYWDPGFRPRPTFESDVMRFSECDRWITDAMFHDVLGDALWRRADTLVWLDLAQPVVLARVVRRSFVRATLGTPLWNGNREYWRGWLHRDHPVPRTITHFRATRAEIGEFVERHPGLTVVRMRRAPQIRAWLASVSEHSGHPKNPG
jgi:Shikimate kinase